MTRMKKNETELRTQWKINTALNKRSNNEGGGCGGGGGGGGEGLFGGANWLNGLRTRGQSFLLQVVPTQYMCPELGRLQAAEYNKKRDRRSIFAEREGILAPEKNQA